MAEPITKLEDLPAATRRVIEANAGNELIPVKRDANGVTKQIITAADIAQIASVGFVTKSGLVL
jgi:hypothetical protein